MKRDMELVRKILLHFQSRDNDSMICPRDIKNRKDLVIEGYKGMLISRHVDVMYEGGLLEGYPARADDSERLIEVYPTRLTWEGHEFLDAALNESAWRKTLSMIKEKGVDLPYSIFKEFLIHFIKAEVGLDD